MTPKRRAAGSGASAAGVTPCGAPTKAGPPCRITMNLSPTTGLCNQHCPERAAERAALHAAGGAAHANAVRRLKAAEPGTAPRAPKTIEDAERVASWITRAVLTGAIDVRVAEAATKAVRQFQLTVEKRHLLDRVRELERQLKAKEQAAHA